MSKVYMLEGSVVVGDVEVVTVSKTELEAGKVLAGLDPDKREAVLKMATASQPKPKRVKATPTQNEPECQPEPQPQPIAA